MSSAMKKLPRTFDTAEISIIQAGEQSGTLHRSFMSLAEDVRNRDDLRKKILSAMTYPLIIVGFLFAAIVIVMVFVIPKLLPLFETAQTELPLSTRSLIATSDFISNHFFLLFFLGIIAGASLYSYAITPSGKEFFDRLLLKIPVVGNVYRNYMIVRMATTLGLLLASGIPILKTLRLTADSTNNAAFQEIIGTSIQSIERGNKIADSFIASDPEHRYFTRDFTQLIAAGEKTSTINKVCTKIAAQYNREVDASIANLVKFIEPMAILVAGVFVVWFAFAIFSAVLKITETVG
jgi:type II secretory pathway component PulF